MKLTREELDVLSAALSTHIAKLEGLFGSMEVVSVWQAKNLRTKVDRVRRQGQASRRSSTSARC